MKIFITTLLLLSSGLCSVALADELDQDTRIKMLTYNEADVYTITTKYGYQTNIVFGPNEEIQTISVGDRSLWQIIPSGHRLFIRPMEDGTVTNMTVLTNRHSYQFDLKSAASEKVHNNIYVAQFVYKDEKKAALPAPLPVTANTGTAPPMLSVTPVSTPAPVSEPVAPAPMVVASYPVAAKTISSAPLEATPAEPEHTAAANYNYTFAGPDELAPLQVYDDGKTTLFKYRDTTQPFPNVYSIDKNGTQVLATPYRRGSYMAVDTVAGEFALKSSAGTVHVYNELLNPASK
jgi:type IV secretion system protein VirB9